MDSPMSIPWLRALFQIGLIVSKPAQAGVRVRDRGSNCSPNEITPEPEGDKGYQCECYAAGQK